MKQLFLFYLFTFFVWAEHNYTNALINEHSVYLQQHAHNPVHWYPWGEEAFSRAKKENKLIFLSIGYSTCHWCHVMEEESFTDKDIAEELNKHFISIKVDREEYPQIDKKYQNLYTKVFGKRGGWPLSVFLSSNKEAFFIGTYIPKERGYGSKGLENLLPSFIALQNEPRSFQNAIIKYKKIHATRKLKRKYDMQLSDTLKTIEKQFDAYNGGFSTRPKFPESSKINLLLEIYQLEHNQKALYMAEHTLTKMAEGGIYDQIGGGFFRYTTDYAWQIPHFEKMLYTNAELISVYAKAMMLTGKKLYKKIVDESIEQMEKNYMRGGLYLSASDADSDGEEGGYYIYEYIEVKSALKYKGWNTQEIDEVLAYIGIEENGNIDGDFSLPHICTTQVPKKLEALKAYLHAQSNQRTFPFVDAKIITAWNAMMIKSLFIASPLDTKYLELAQKRLTKLLEVMRPKNILYHQTLLGHDATQKALLEDYAFLIDALIVGYEYTYEVRYLSLAMTLTEEALRKFYRKRLWYLSDDGIEVEADFDDRYYTAALSVMFDNLLRLGTLKELPSYHKIVEESISTMGGVLDTAPQNASKLVSVYLRLKYQDILIHASKKKLLRGQKEIQSIDYPFVLSQTQESDAYLACKGTTCFAYDKNISKLIEKIKEVQ